MCASSLQEVDSFTPGIERLVVALEVGGEGNRLRGLMVCRLPWQILDSAQLVVVEGHCGRTASHSRNLILLVVVPRPLLSGLSLYLLSFCLILLQISTLVSANVS